MGTEEPRLYTEPLRVLSEATSLGPDFARFCRDDLGTPLLPWQERWSLRALELNPDGSLRFRVVLLLVARQNGKSFLVRSLALYAMLRLGVQLVLGSAQSLDIAREAWGGACDLAEDLDLSPEIRRANGQESLRIGKSRYRIAASTRQAGRGLSVDLLVVDEAREHRSWDAWGALSKTTAARPHALTLVVSNAGDDESVVLNSLRERALAGEDESLGIFEWSAVEGCDLDDPAAWAQANPALGHTLTETAIRSALATDPAGVFRTEVLCQRVSALDTAVDPLAWADCADPEGTLDTSRERVAVCLDVSPDQKHVTLMAAAVQPDGRVRVEVVEAWPSPQAARADLPELLARVKPRKIGWFPGGPAGTLAADLETSTLSGRIHEIRGGDVTAACQGLAEQVSARRLLHNGDPLLSAQIRGVSRLYSGDGWRFQRKGAGHADAAYATAGAVHLARLMPRPIGGKRILLPD